MSLITLRSGLLSTCIIAAHYALAVINGMILVKIGELVVLLSSQLLNLLQY